MLVRQTTTCSIFGKYDSMALCCTFSIAMIALIRRNFLDRSVEPMRKPHASRPLWVSRPFLKFGTFAPLAHSFFWFSRTAVAFFSDAFYTLTPQVLPNDDIAVPPLCFACPFILLRVPCCSLAHWSLLAQFKGMCLANPSLTPQEACAELERLHDQVHLCSVGSIFNWASSNLLALLRLLPHQESLRASMCDNSDHVPNMVCCRLHRD